MNTVSSQKNINIPDWSTLNEDTILISIKVLKAEVDNSLFLKLQKWLIKNWIQLDNYDLYTKPYCRYDYKYQMKGSNDDDPLDLKKDIVVNNIKNNYIS